MEELQIAAEETGYTKGHAAGLLLATKSGLHLGSLASLDIHTRLGFYTTLSTHLLARTPAPKVTGILQSILKLCNGFPERNDQAVDMMGVLRDVEGKWKMVRKLWVGDEVLPLYGEGKKARESVGKTPVDLDF
jgi:hypothetical protein